VFTQPASAGETAWVSNHLEHQFAVGAQADSEDGRPALRADQYSEGHLDSYSFDTFVNEGLTSAPDTPASPDVDDEMTRLMRPVTSKWGTHASSRGVRAGLDRLEPIAAFGIRGLDAKGLEYRMERLRVRVARPARLGNSWGLLYLAAALLCFAYLRPGLPPLRRAIWWLAEALSSRRPAAWGRVLPP